MPVLSQINGVVASYPRSGNTYIRLCVAYHLFNRISDEKEIDNFVIDPYQTTARRALKLLANKKSFVKWHALPMRYPIQTKVLYVERDPIRVFYSLYSYLKYRHRQIDSTPEEYTKKFMSSGFGTFGNVKSHHQIWSAYARNNENVRSVRFEDMLRDDAVLRPSLEFLLGTMIKPSQLAKIRDSVSAESVQERQTDSSSNFFFSKDGHEELRPYEDKVRQWYYET